MRIKEAISREASRRRYSKRTIETYQFCVRKFFEYCKKDPKKVSKKDIREFLEISLKNKSGNTINVYLNSLKFYFEEILGKKMKLNIKYSKVPEKLPEILSKEEIKKLLSSINNSKHKLMIKLLYSSGLRVSELTNLKIKDLYIEKGYGFVRSGKGNKDRIFIIAEN
ncbi:MAG: phage integrase N-terminal SAM-like domain-containing protein [Candidatus Aenigmarchaeota archaeon]|nr:phage integrase N-terminal SAM-like domain-containing protein [Candidatus Aenigmarchaeota archaeon]